MYLRVSLGFIILLIPTALWNHDIFLFLNTIHYPVLDYIFGVTSGLADYLVTLLFVFLVMLFHLRLGLAALVTYILAGASNQILKHIFDMPRPPALFENIHILGEPLYHLSFPSGHATSSGALACLALHFWQDKPKQAWAVFILFVFVAYGRIYGGVHFPIDVLVGFTMGAAIMGWIEHVSKQWNLKIWEQNEWSWKLPGLILVFLATIIGTGHQIQPSTAQPLALVLPIAALILLMQAWKKRLLRES